jgi:hypothetical protein
MGIVCIMVREALWKTIPPIIGPLLTLTSEMCCLKQARMANRTDGTLASVLRQHLEPKHLLPGPTCLSAFLIGVSSVRVSEVFLLARRSLFAPIPKS